MSDVKNTIPALLADMIAPHYCRGCGMMGYVVCESCKYDIVSEMFGRCIVCAIPTTGHNLCNACAPPYARAWTLGVREGVLRDVLDAYKFERVAAGLETIIDLLDRSLPCLPDGTVVTSIPTIPSHIRRRGHDHAAQIARGLARRRKLSFRALLARETNAVQVGSGKKQRWTQAEKAFRVKNDSDMPQRVLLVDDVYTTGATVHHASRVLQDAGVEEVWVAVVAKQEE